MIRTVFGDKDKQQMERGLIHEDIQCVSDDVIMVFENMWLDEKSVESYAVYGLCEIKSKLGVNTYVD